MCPHGVIPLCAVPILTGKLSENVFKNIRAVVANAAFYLFAFRVFSCCIELYFISEYFIYALEEEEVVQTKKEKKKI